MLIFINVRTDMRRDYDVFRKMLTTQTTEDELTETHRIGDK